jgi:hypothetical protein
MWRFPKQFSVKALLGATALWAVYFASLPQFLEGRDPPIIHFVVSCLSGALIARGLGYRSIIADAVGGAIGSAVGIGAPALFLFLFPQLHTYTRWGGYGFPLDFAAWFLMTVMASVMGGFFALIITSLIRYSRRWRG